jgi:TolB-like protein/class 3 adenylate cyclase/Tfp pilus assembly protein PilF
MAEERVERRLAAILCADVVGYSRLMGVDEEGTHVALKRHQREFIDPLIEQNHGRLFKTTGDGLLIEFASVVDAVRCAILMQQGMDGRNAGRAESERVRFRIGINLGDVIAEDDDIFGDGVNVAARLEALAEPGGICVSGVVHDQIQDKLPYRFADRGEQNVKNIARPVRVYSLGLEDRSASREPIATLRYRVTSIATGLAAIAALVIAAGAWLWPATKSTPAVTAATSIAQPITAPRLSIVVLPFANLGNDPDQQYFADGITEDVTTDLSRIANSFVISRNTAFTYKDKRVDTKQIGREVGVRYVLEGSVRRSGSKVRVNAQLIDAETDAHLWAEQFDGDIGDLFALQSEITGRIASALSTELVGAEVGRSTANPDALDYILRGRATLNRGNGRENWAEAARLFEGALILDPSSTGAKTWLALAIIGPVLNGVVDPSGADLKRAGELIEQALIASPLDPLAHLAKGQLLRAQGRFADAIPEYEAVIESDRNQAVVYAILGWCKFAAGLADDEVVQLAEQAIRLNPRHPSVAIAYNLIASVRLYQSSPDPDEAIVWREKAVQIAPKHPWGHLGLAIDYGFKGDISRAAAELAEAQKLSDRFSSISRFRASAAVSSELDTPANRARFEAIVVATLRKVGMPEE